MRIIGDQEKSSTHKARSTSSRFGKTKIFETETAKSEQGVEILAGGCFPPHPPSLPKVVRSPGNDLSINAISPSYVAPSWPGYVTFIMNAGRQWAARDEFEGTIRSKGWSKPLGLLHFAKQYQWDIGETYRLSNSVGQQ
jgi:hypothetical protein